MTLNTTEYNTIKSNLLQIAMIISPTSKEQASFTALIHYMESNGEKYEFIVDNLLDAIIDGLRYSNWPKGEI